MSFYGGRPQHSFWKAGGFLMKKIDNKNVAFCKNCKKILKNTAESRLKIHRRGCKIGETEISKTNCSSLSDTDVNDNSITGSFQQKVRTPEVNKDSVILEAHDISQRAQGSEVDEYWLDVSENSESEASQSQSYDIIFDSTANDSLMDISEIKTTSAKINDGSQHMNLLVQHQNSTSGTPEKSVQKSRKLLRQKSCNSYIDIINNTEQNELNISCGEFFFGCNIPFSVIESDYFKKFVQKLRPAFKPITRKTLSTIILNKVYEKYTIERKNITIKDGVLLIDGWKNSSANSKQVVCMIHNAAGEMLFLESFDFTREKENAEALIEVVNKAVVLAKQKFNINIYAVVSDNVSTMMRMGRLISLWHLTCNSHSANLLAKSLVEKDTAHSVNEILIEFKSPALEREIVERKGTKMVFAEETRWCSYRDAFVCFLKNLSIMRFIAGEGKFKIKQETIQLLFDEQFVEKIQHSIIIFDPVCALINNCQSSAFSIADTAEEWLKLEMPVHNDDYEELISARLKKVINSIILAANLLHPGYQGLRFYSQNNTYADMSDEFLISNLSATGISDLQEYKHKRGIFETLFEKSEMSQDFLGNYGEKTPRTFLFCVKITEDTGFNSSTGEIIFQLVIYSLANSEPPYCRKIKTAHRYLFHVES